MTLNLSEAVTVAGGTPTLTLNDGGTATLHRRLRQQGANLHATPWRSVQNTARLAATAVNLNGATIKDASAKQPICRSPA